MEPADAKARVAKVMDGYATEAAEVSAKQASRSPDVAEAALQAWPQSHPNEFAQAAQRHFDTGRPEYAAAVTDCGCKLETANPDFILVAQPIAGRKVWYDTGSGRILVRNEETGYTLAWDDAVRQRMIGVQSLGKKR